MDFLSGSGNKLVSSGVIFHISFLDTLMTFLKRGEDALPPWKAHNGAGWALSASHFGALELHPHASTKHSSFLHSSPGSRSGDLYSTAPVRKHLATT